MELKPVKGSRVPAYPTKLEILADPGILEARIPSGWSLLGKEMAGALSVLLAAGVACAAETTSPPTDAANAEITAATAAIVAPIFEHGEGRGSVGCVVISPPAFISEEEAREIIREEMLKYGVDLREEDTRLPSVKTGPREEGIFISGNNAKYGLREVEPMMKELEGDLKDPRHNVVVEFASNKDYFQLGGLMPVDTAYKMDLKGVAHHLAEKVKSTGKEAVYFGVFYDPMTDHRGIVSRQPGEPEKRDEQSKDQLRKQVKEFAEWLKAQGVI